MQVGRAKPRAVPSELDRVKRREAEFRANMVKEFLDRGERNTYLNTLRAEKTALAAQLQQARLDLESLVRRLEAESERAASLDSEINRVRASVSWRLLKPFRAVFSAVFGSPGAVSPASGTAPGSVFTYYLHTSPFRLYREPSFTLRGWAWPEDGRAITAIRLNLDGECTPGRYGLEEPDVVARYGIPKANPRPGFEITFKTPPGRHFLSLEAQLDGSEWRAIMKTSIWCEPTST
jgi:hypothetical protein